MTSEGISSPPYPNPKETDMAARELEWGNAHRLTLQDCSGRADGVLKLEKPGGRQFIPVLFPLGVMVENVVAAWEAQGSKWVELFLCERPHFLALRVIWLPEGQALVWLVVHIMDTPHDLCAIAPLTPADWPKKIVAIASAAGAA